MAYSTNTRLFPIDIENPDSAVIRAAAGCLLAGGLVAFPTETVYGLGANALDADAINRIYSAKGRPANNPLIVHIASPEQLEQVASEIPDIARALASAFWPGPLTLVLKRQARVPPNISAGRETVAVRMPAHPVALALIRAAGVPIAAPSANLFTRPSATTAQHVLADLDGRVDVILDGGPTRIGLESTVLDLTGQKPIILRPGGVTLEALRNMISHVELHKATIAMDDAEAAPLSPGMLLKHYSPNAELLLFVGDFVAVTARMQQIAREYIAGRKQVGILALDEERAFFDNLGAQIVPLGSKNELEIVGHHLFAGLRALDEKGVDVILVRGFEQVGLGVTIQDRLLRAAEGRVIHV
jgi:L-threonylcarbamoyladenylate synthase